MAPKGKAESKATTTANLGFEQKLWQTADALRNNMDAAEYKHVVLGLIFLKYISDAFEATRGHKIKYLGVGIPYPPRDTLLPKFTSGELRV
jgi:hypothetical protein